MKVSMFRLIHISDVHLSPFPRPSLWQLFNKRITGWVNWNMTRKGEMGDIALEILVKDIKKQQGDHTMITGDLVNLALPAEFLQAREWVAHLGKSNDVSMIFGNHDAYVPGAFAQACRVFSPWIRGDKPLANGAPFPYMRQRNSTAIIGTSSAVATLPFRATGKFDKRQAEDLAQFLKDAGKSGLFRVVAIHHPPLYKATHHHKKLYGIGRFQRVIAEHGAELILHGHTHLPTLSYIPGVGRQVPVVGVASASQDFGGAKPPANYNLFEIDKKNGDWRCILIRRGIIDAQGRINEIMRKDLFKETEVCQ